MRIAPAPSAIETDQAAARPGRPAGRTTAPAREAELAGEALPLYLQDAVRGLSPLQSGLIVMPGGLAMGLLGPQVGKLFDRFGSKPLVIPGAVGVVALFLALSQIGTTTRISRMANSR